MSRTARTPLHSAAARVDAALTWMQVRIGLPESAAGWTRCSDVDAAFLAEWEKWMAGSLTRTYGRTHPMTASGFCLGYYAGIPGRVGGAMFRLARRVPRLDRASLAFSCRPDAPRPDSVALLDPRFWCLPGDPDAEHPDATVVADDSALAAVLRAQVRTHADEFLAGYRGGARLPRRGLLGSFVDGIDTGVWFGGDPAAHTLPVEGSAVLPGGTAEFCDASSLHLLVDARERTHVSRRRVGCCYYFKVADGGRACATCPRVDDAERALRYAEVE